MTTPTVSLPRMVDPPDPPGWRQRAACRGIADPEVFFPNTTGPKRADGRDHPEVEAAKAICATCKVLDECREFALADPGISGVWGGLWQDELRAERRRRMRRAQARKETDA